uniref:U650x n=1 Tax=Mycobacterium leprae TaxID=1769 RepID=Q50118_MYCLR|nr:u650x [Mycobacterium leprae]
MEESGVRMLLDATSRSVIRPVTTRYRMQKGSLR